MARTRAAVLAAVLAVVMGDACGLLRHRDHTEQPAPIDLNHASLRKVEKLPGITPSMARRIVDGRPYTSVHDLVDRGILTEHELDRVSDLVTVADHGR